MTPSVPKTRRRLATAIRSLEPFRWEAYDGRETCTIPNEPFMAVGIVGATVWPVQPVYDLNHSPERRAAVLCSVLDDVVAGNERVVVFVTVSDLRPKGANCDHQAFVHWSGRRLTWFDPLGPWKDMWYASRAFSARMAARGLPIHSADKGTGIQQVMRNDSCVFLAAYAAKVLTGSADVEAALADLHDPRAARRHADAIARHARAMTDAMT